MFPYSNCLHATIKYAAQCITYLPIKPKNMICITCDLGFCDEFPEYNITDEELYYRPNASYIHFSVYTNQIRLAKYGIITNGPSACRISK